MATRSSVPIRVSPTGKRSFPRRREPVRLGVPLARGACVDAGQALLVDSTGRRQPLQARTLDRWNDGSIRWLLLDFQADHDGQPSAVDYHLQFDDAASPIDGPLLHIAHVDDGLLIDTAAARFRLRAGGGFLFEEVLVSGVPVIDPKRSGFRLENAARQACTVTVDRIQLEEQGPLRAVVRIDARVGESTGEPMAKLLASLHFFAGSTAVRVALTLRNPRRAAHQGGLWELGDRGSVFIRDASFVLALPTGERAEAWCSPEVEAPFACYSNGLELFQASSGGANWDSANHINRYGVVPLAWRGYRLSAPQVETTGLRATPVVSLVRHPHQIAMTLPQFWQTFPKAMEATDAALVLRLFPHQHGDLHELQGGEQKTDVFWVTFGRDAVTDVPLDWTREPLLAHTAPCQYCSSGAVQHLIAASDDPDSGYQQLVVAAIEGEDTFEHKRERIDEYGWRNAGDLYADHEAAFHSGPHPLVSHYNNQYDAIAGFAYQFMRTGDARWWQLFCTLAAHVVDIDIYHTDRDKAAYNGGSFWHTAHYTDAGRSSHRAYPRAEKIGGGGPSCEHNYSTGLMFHHFLTGEALSREAVVDLARWVVDMDDGRKTVFRVLASGDTGLASATASPLYHGPGRGAGNSITALLNGHRLSGDPTLLGKAEVLIRRCIHPSDDVERRELLDAEARWSYTVFLCALGRYLDHKTERNEIDSTYAYARDSLLTYAMWMSVHERHYLDHPETLEFPTETWAAQELWKTEAFLFGAKHSTGDVRTRFLERADSFFRYSIATLQGMETRTLTRPMVLLLSHGFMNGYFHRHPNVTAPPVVGGIDHGQPANFVPQKERAKKRLIAWLAMVAALAVAGAFTLLL